MIDFHQSRKTYIMGIINATPDSFSGDGLVRAGGDWQAHALAQAERFLMEGAEILDIGGESTRPGAEPVSVDEERTRVIPLITTLKQRFPEAVISIDTMKAEIAREAVQAGAEIINDVTAGAHDPDMAEIVRQSGAWVVLMHHSARLDDFSRDDKLGNAYRAEAQDDIVTNVIDGLTARTAAMTAQGVAPERIILDPGIGFGKTVKDNLRLINRLDRLHSLNMPLLLGASRKSFIGKVLDVPPDERLIGSVAAALIGKMRGAQILRVHDVKETVAACAMFTAVTAS